MTDTHVQNLQALKRLSAAQIGEHLGQYALFVQGRVQQYFNSNREALRTAVKHYALGEFSVLRVEPQPADTGFLDCADYPGKIE